MSNESSAIDIKTILRSDLLASVVVFLVALPLCMGIAIASGAPPAAGLITGIVGGLVVGFIAGAPLQVSGPAAGLSVIVWELIQTHGYGALGWIIIVAGVVQIVAGLIGFGRWFRAVSPAVIHGMLAGIGILIFASQFHVMVDDAPRGSGLDNLLAIPEAIMKGYTPTEDSVHFHAAMIGLFTLSILISWKFIVPGKLKAVPGPLAAVVGATALASYLALDVIRVNVPESMLDAIAVPPVADLATLGWGVLGSGFALAFIASAETLLCASAVDKMHTGPRAKFDRELAAQGVGNMICGALGALPMTGVIVRSSANVEAGGKTRASAILHGGWLLLFVVALPFILRAIPTSVLAAVLVFTGYKLVNIAAIQGIAKLGRAEVGIYAATVLGIVAVDLLTGVVAGIALSLARILYDMANLEIKIEKAAEGEHHDMWLTGSATVVSLPKLAGTLEELPNDMKLHVHLHGLDYIDHACLDLLVNWQKQHEAMGGELMMDWEGLQARFGNRELSPGTKKPEAA
ncbi:MAG: SulP family inorganic anion transporter [Myxococcota bacterium]